MSDPLIPSELQRLADSTLTDPAKPAMTWPIMSGGQLIGWSGSYYDVARELAREVLTLRADLAQARADLEAAQDRLTWPRWVLPDDVASPGEAELYAADMSHCLAMVWRSGAWRAWGTRGSKPTNGRGGIEAAEAFLVEHGRIRAGCTIRPAEVSR